MQFELDNAPYRVGDEHTPASAVLRLLTKYSIPYSVISACGNRITITVADDLVPGVVSILAITAGAYDSVLNILTK